MKYLYLVLLLLPLKVLGQVKLQDVTINGKQPKFVRLKGYFRSYQHNDSLLKYYEDGIVEYYINLKNEKVYLRKYGLSCKSPWMLPPQITRTTPPNSTLLR